jgi:hypothetical protein
MIDTFVTHALSQIASVALAIWASVPTTIFIVAVWRKIDSGTPFMATWIAAKGVLTKQIGVPVR